VVFVTHDLDEAVKLGDRIAVMAVGGVLEQLDTPDGLLARPASSFVESFVGRDRSVKRLAVVGLARTDLAHPPTIDRDAPPAEAAAALERSTFGQVAVLERGVLVGWVRGGEDSSGRLGAHLQPAAATARLGMPLRDALALLLDGDDWLAVADDEGRYLGVIGAVQLVAAARRDAAPG
jgi:osmoprotectant transport system ATP-binding protein